MARGVEEGNGTAVDINVIRADMLSNTAGFAGDDIGMADIVEQRGLAVVDMAHDNDDGGAWNEILRLILMVVYQTFLNRDDDFLFDLAAKLHRDKSRGIVVNDV